MHVPAGQYLFFTAANFISKIRRQFSKFVKIREFREIFFAKFAFSVDYARRNSEESALAPAVWWLAGDCLMARRQLQSTSPCAG